jgi:flagellar biosynthetic protein FlhB
MADAQDRRLPATERKIRKARAEGQVPRSRDLSHFAAIGAAIAVLAAVAPALTDRLSQLFAAALRFDASALVDAQSMIQRLQASSTLPLLLVALLGLLMGLVALASGVLAGGWNFSWKALVPKFDKIDPIAGIGRMFSKHQLTNTLKSCVLALVLGTIGALYLQLYVPELFDAIGMPLPSALGHVA